MSKVFYRKKFSDYLGEQRAIDDIIMFFEPEITPSPTPTPSITPSITPTQTLSPTPTLTPTSSLTPTPSITPTLTPTSSLTPTPSITPTLTKTPTQTPTLTPTPTTTITPTPSSTPTPRILNIYPGAAGAYSMRLLNNGYSGSAIRVRRSSDNVELDIAFDGNGNLDTTTLTTFTGPNNAFITTWYDQSGNGRNLLQPTSICQPQIISGGTIITKGTNNKPAIKFDGSNDHLVRTGLSLDNTTFSSFLVYGSDTTNDSAGVFVLTPPSGNDYQSLSAVTFETGGPTQLTGFLNDFTNGSGVFALYENGNGPTPYSLRNGMKQSTGAQLLVSGVTVDSVTKSLNNGTSTGVLLGARFLGAISAPYFDGFEQEIIYYLIDQSGNIVSINSDINSYYGIY